MSDLTPVFIFSAPRSGTTMLGAMLGASSEAVTLPEAPFIGYLHYRYLREVDSVPAQRIVDEINGSFRLAHWEIGRLDDRFPVPEHLDDAGYGALVEAMVRAFIERQGARGVRVWIEHSPVHSRYVEGLQRVFPRARFVHLVRDGRAVAASTLPLDWGANTIREAAAGWLEDIAYGVTAEQLLGPDVCLRVHYEALLLSPDETLKTICDFLSLPYEADMVRGQGFHVPDYTRSQHELVGQEPDKERLSAWRAALTEREVKIFEDSAGPMLLRLGYDLTQTAVPQPTVFYERVAMGAKSFVKKELKNRLANKVRRMK